MTCPECDGTGVVIEEVMALMALNYARFREPFWEEREVECDECRGTGECEAPCTNCYDSLGEVNDDEVDDVGSP